jgi:hypothetical protein
MVAAIVMNRIMDEVTVLENKGLCNFVWNLIQERFAKWIPGFHM